MKLTKDLKNLFKQALLESYGIVCTHIEQVDQDGFIRYALKGELVNKLFRGSLNIFRLNDSYYEFNITGFFDGDSRTFMNYILRDNPYIAAINEVQEVVIGFDRAILFSTRRFHIGSGSFRTVKNTFTDIEINAFPLFNINLDIEEKDTDKQIDKLLLNTTLTVEDKQSKFCCVSEKDYTLHVVGQNFELEDFKRMLICEYMLTYSKMTGIPLLMDVKDFKNISYSKMLDHIKVQEINDFT